MAVEGRISEELSDGSVTEAKQSLSDVTTHNVSTTKHGYAPKAPNDATQYLDGTGSWSVPAGVKAIIPCSSTGSAVITTSDVAPTMGFSFAPAVKSGTYKLVAFGRVSALSGSPTQVYLRTPAAGALAKSSSGGGTTTIVAANTQIASFNKGGVLALGERFRIEYPDISLEEGDVVTINGTTSTFLVCRINVGTSATIGFSFALVET